MKKLLGLICFVLLIPFPYTVIPEWSVKITHTDGTPARNQEVLQTWTDLSVVMGFWMSSETLRTDESGNVIFPQRRFYSPLLLRGLGFGLATIDFWSHASYGPMAHFSVPGGFHPSITYRPGTLLKSNWEIYPANSRLNDPFQEDRRQIEDTENPE